MFERFPVEAIVWFVEAEGQRLGPFNLEKVQDLLLQGKVRPNDRVTGDHMQGRWMTVREAVDAYVRKTATGMIHLPPRPLETPSSPPRPSVPGHDPVMGLFDVLQHAKSRQNAPRSAISGVQNQSSSRRKIPPQLWLVAALSLVLLASIGIIVKMLQHAGDQIDPSAVAAKSVDTPKGASAAPAAAMAPAAAPAAASASNPGISVSKPAPMAPPPQPIKRFAPQPVAPPPAALINNQNFERERERDNDREREHDQRERETLPKDREREREDDWRAKDERGEPVTTDKQPAHGEPNDPAAGGGAIHP